jgi:septum formation protein
LLKAAGVDFEVATASVDEDAIREAVLADGGVEPGDLAEILARTKAENVLERNRGAVVVGADQVLALGERIFSKPADVAEARDHLFALRGRTHHLVSAVVVLAEGEEGFAMVETAQLTMRDLSAEEIGRYLSRAGEAVTQSVGAYQLEGVGIQLFERIEGDYFTILGLPLLPLLAELRRRGLAGP